MQHPVWNNTRLSFLTKLIALSHLELWFVAIYVDAKWLTIFSMAIKQRHWGIFLGLGFFDSYVYALFMQQAIRTHTCSGPENS